MSLPYRIAGWIEVALWTLGTSALFVVGYTWSEASKAQARGAEELRELAQSPSKQRSIREGDVFGRVEIPGIDLTAMIFEGTSQGTLDRGVGHLSFASQPLSTGNVVLAAHRDTFFRSLRDIQRGDDITLTTPQGARHYRVLSMEVVEPSEVSVIHPTSRDTLTLITCYPFTWVGSAPNRFVVHADPVD